MDELSTLIQDVHFAYAIGVVFLQFEVNGLYHNMYCAPAKCNMFSEHLI